MIFLVPPEFGNRTGDNLTRCEDDEYDENACYNWADVHQLYDNHKARFHPTQMNLDPAEP